MTKHTKIGSGQRLFINTIFLCCLFFFVNHAVYSQSANPTTKSDTIIAEVIEPIALSNIGTASEEAIAVFRDTNNRIAPGNSEIEIDSLMPEKLSQIQKTKDDLNLEEIEGMSLRQTEAIKNDANQLRILLKGWRSSLSEKTEDIKELKEVLANLNDKWELTLNLERTEKLPQQVEERIQSIIKEIDLLSKKLTTRNNKLLTMQDELTGALIYLDEILNAISKTEQSYRSQLLTIDSPPIWQIFNVEGDTLTFGQKVKDVVASQSKDFATFRKNYESDIVYHILFFVFLTILFFYMKQEVGRWSDEKKDKTIKSAIYVISKPFSASLLVSLMLTHFFYDEAPEDALNYYYALLIVPIITILPGLIPSIKKKYFYFFGGLFFLIQVTDYFSNIIALERSMLILFDLLTAIFLISLILERKEIEKQDKKMQWGFAFFIMQIGTFILILSGIANIAGNTIFSKVLSRGSLTLIYGGIIVYCSTIVLKSLVALIVQHNSVSKLNMIKNYPNEVKGQLFKIIHWSATLFWLYITLSGYIIYEPIIDWIGATLSKEWELGSVALSIGSVLAFFITLWISILVANFMRFILEDEIFTHFEMPRGVPGAISMLVKLSLIILGFILAFGAAEIDMSKMSILLGALGVGIGFGLQNIFNNLVSGLIIAFERPIQTGDVVQIASLNLMGEVKEIGIRASTVRTFEGAEVIVPNGNLISNEMINWTLSDHKRRQEIIVGVAYGTDTQKVTDVLNKIVSDHENILKVPNPRIFFLGFGDSSLDFRVLFWTHFDNGLGTKSAIGLAIDSAFKKEGISIPFPQRDLHLPSIIDKAILPKEIKTVRRKAKSTKKANTIIKPDSPIKTEK